MPNKKLFFMCLIVMLVPMALSAVELEVVTENWRPYNYDDNGIVKGVSTEIVRKVLDHSKIDYKIHVYPWPRAYTMALHNSNCMIYTIIRIAPREKLFQWIRPLGKGGTTSLYRLRNNNSVRVSSIEDAKKYTIVTNKDSMDHIWLTYHNFKNLYTPPKVVNSITMFFAGRGDLIAFDDSVIKDEFSSAGHKVEDAIKVIPLFETPPYMALSRSTSSEILFQLQNAYDELFAKGEIQLVN